MQPSTSVPQALIVSMLVGATLAAVSNIDVPVLVPTTSTQAAPQPVVDAINDFATTSI